jgi:2'-5' RNA ligase
MAFALELFFDSRCEARLRRLCGSLRQTQIGGAVLIDDVKARPHITLAVCDDADEKAMCQVVRELAQQTAAMPVILSSLGMFPSTESVLFLAPVVEPELLEVHRRADARLSEFTKTPWRFYKPGRWVPHCTLALKLPLEGVQRAIEILAESSFPITGELVEIGVSEFDPGVVKRYLCTNALM